VSLIVVTSEDRGEAGVVARVTVDNAEQRNALGNAGKRELAEAFEGLVSDPRLRVVVLTGAGDRSFIGGANVTEMATFTHGHASEGPSLTHRVCEAIRRTPVPVIARVNGYCFGAGLEIAAACDMRAAVDTARFGMPEVLFGLPSGMEACLLPQLIGWGKTRELAGISTRRKPPVAIWWSGSPRQTVWTRRSKIGYPRSCRPVPMRYGRKRSSFAIGNGCRSLTLCSRESERSRLRTARTKRNG
jgi:enoyl-CoA hydratase/carnithine racemase